MIAPLARSRDETFLQNRYPILSVTEHSMIHLRRLAAVLCCAAAACTSEKTAGGASSAGVDSAALAITPNGLLQHIEDLSADSMEGRAPGTPGEAKAIAYMQSQFKAIGLQPGNPDGTYLQNVDLIGYKAHPTASFSAGGKTISLAYPADFIANSRHDKKGQGALHAE